MKKNIVIPIVACALILITSCVSSKKYKSAVSEVEQLKAQANDLNTQVNTLQKQVSDMTNTNKSLTANLVQCKKVAEEQGQKIVAARAALVEQYKTMERVQDRLQKALADFNDKGVDVYEKGGLVYVSLSEQLLYKSGSAKLGDEGKKALGSLAAALNEYPKLPVIVVGFTDDVHVKNGDNWSLSTERANGVVRVLQKDYNVDPARLTAAGKGKFSPIADNTTTEGRAKNRRTEIILNPDLDRIWEEARKDHN